MAAPTKLYTVVIIRKDGDDGPKLDLEVGESYLFGSDAKCQIRLKPEYVTGVAEQHARISVDHLGKASIVNLSGQDGSVKVKTGAAEAPITKDAHPLQHGDLISICTRSFRFEEIAKRDEKASSPAKPVPKKKGAEGGRKGQQQLQSDESKRYREISGMGLGEKDSDLPMKDWGSYSGRRAQKRRNSAPAGDHDGETPSKKRGGGGGGDAMRRKSEVGKLGKWADAARRVLEKECRPLTVREIADKALEYGFVTECGKTPQNSITSTLHSEIKKPNPLFTKVAAATFTLATPSGSGK